MPRRAVTTLTKRRVAAAAGWRCDACAVLVDEYYEIDHRVPLHLGGSNRPDDLALLCGRCNRHKSRTEGIEREAWLSAADCRGCGRTHSRYFLHVCE